MSTGIWSKIMDDEMGSGLTDEEKTIIGINRYATYDQGGEAEIPISSKLILQFSFRK